MSSFSSSASSLTSKEKKRLAKVKKAAETSQIDVAEEVVEVQGTETISERGVKTLSEAS